MKPSYTAEVVADRSGQFCGNNCYFATAEEAKQYADDLAGRWMLVTATRVVSSDKPVNYAFEDGRAKMLA